MVGVFDDFARFGFLAALEVGVAQEVHGMGLIVRFRLVHFRGMRASGIGGNIRGDGILPQAEAHKDMRRHVQGVSGVRRDGRITAGSVKALGCEFGTIRGMDQVVRNTGVVRMLSKQPFEEGDGLL